jgi:hypothetical protein
MGTREVRRSEGIVSGLPLGAVTLMRFAIIPGRTMVDTPGSMLSKSQRQYLKEQKNPDPAAERALRARIRDRVVAGMRDFILLEDHLQPQDKDQIFARLNVRKAHEERNGIQDENDRNRAHNTIHRALEFFYKGVGKEEFERLLRLAIKNAEYDSEDEIPGAPYVDVRFENNKIQVEKRLPTDFDYGEIGRKIEQEEYDSLTESELKAWLHRYQQAGELDPDIPSQFDAQMRSAFGVDSPEE